MSQCDPTKFLLKVKKREKRDELFDHWFDDTVTPQRYYWVNPEVSTTTAPTTFSATRGYTYITPWVAST